LRQKKSKNNLGFQQDKIKKMHEDYFISMVDCGVNIPHEKVEQFSKFESNL